MKPINLKKLFMIHSWVGIITGILLFVIAFTGAISVLSKPELKIWANPEIHQLESVPAIKIKELVNKYHLKVPQSFGENIHIYMPTAYETHLLTILFESHDGDENYQDEAAYAFEFDPVTFELVNEFYGLAQTYYDNKKTDAPSFIGHFHADLHLGRPIGLILTGFLGLTLLVSTITGLFIHRQYLKELFTFRRKKGLDVLVSDAHKIMGIWGSLFYGVIGFTGAFLGLASVILLPAAAFVSFGGDQEKLVSTFTIIPKPEITHQILPTQLDTIIIETEQRYPKAAIRNITVMAHNDANADVYLSILGGEAVQTQLIQFKGDGEFVKSMSTLGDIPGVSIQVLNLLFPLHFGNFGGLFVKLLWTFLGLATALLPISGMMMWLSKRTRGSNPSLSVVAYQRWNRVIIGSCGGLVLACAILFPAQLILNYAVAGNLHNNYFGPLFFYTWLAWFALAVLPINYHRYLQITVIAFSVACISVLPLNILLSDSHAFMANNLFITLVDLTFFVIGFTSLWWGTRGINKRFKAKSAIMAEGKTA